MLRVDRSVFKVIEMPSVLPATANTTAAIDFCLSTILQPRLSSVWTDRALSRRFVGVARFVRGHLGCTRRTLADRGGGHHRRIDQSDVALRLGLWDFGLFSQGMVSSQTSTTSSYPLLMMAADFAVLIVIRINISNLSMSSWRAGVQFRTASTVANAEAGVPGHDAPQHQILDSRK